MVVLKLVTARWWQCVVVDHVLGAGKVNIIALVDEDNDDERHKVERVDRLMAVLHEEGGDEESERTGVHQQAEHIVEEALLVAALVLELLWRGH